MGTLQHYLKERAEATPDVLAVIAQDTNYTFKEFHEAPRAYIIKREGSPLTEAVILTECQKKLAEYKIPEVRFVHELPKNGLGKVIKHVLKEQAAKEVTVNI